MNIPLLHVVLAMISIQSGAAVAKSLFTDLGPAGTTALRIGFSAVMLWATWRPAWPRGPALRWVAQYGAVLGLMNLSFYFAIARIPLGLAVALEFTGPLVVALLSSRRPRDVAWVLLATAGLSLLTPIASTNALDPVGILLALLAAVCWALYIVFGQRAGRMLPAGVVTTVGMSVAALITVPIGLAQNGLKLFEPRYLPLGLAVAALASAIPYSFEMNAMRRMPARQFGLLMSLEPVFASVSGLVFLGERLGPTQVLAVALVVAAVVGQTLTVPSRATCTQC